MNNYGISDELISQLKKAKQSVEDVEKTINLVASKATGISKGDIVEDIYNGYHYEVGWFSVSFDRVWNISVNLYAHRVWRTGRKAGMSANSGSFLSVTSLKKVEANDKA